VSFLQCADDTLFFYEESWSNVIIMKAILRGFEIASSLEINFHKSKLQESMFKVVIFSVTQRS